jgi:hypothetical protein
MYPSSCLNSRIEERNTDGRDNAPAYTNTVAVTANEMELFTIQLSRQWKNVIFKDYVVCHMKIQTYKLSFGVHIPSYK